MAKKGVKPTPQKPGHKPAPRAAHRSEAAKGQAFSRFQLIGFGLAAFAFLLYINTLGHQYVLDDPLAVSENQYVKQGISGIPQLLTHHYRAGTEGANASALLYRPLSPVTFAVEWSLAPNSPFLGHFMNVLWYALTVGLLFGALRHILHGYHWLWAAGATLLFAAHPLHTEVVANIKSRDEILNVFFSVAALYAWARWLEGPAARWLALALGGYFLALLSKESAVALLPVFPLAGWFFFDKPARQSAGHALLFALPVAVFLIMRAAVLGQSTDHFVVSEMDNPIVAASGFGERSATSFLVLWKYLQLLVFPYPLLSDYSYKHLAVAGWGNWQALAGLAAYGGLIVFAVRGLLRRQALAFCAAAYLCSIVLYSQLLLVIGTLFGERLAYMPSLWFCTGVAYLLWRVSGFNLNAGAGTPEMPPVSAVRASAALALLIVAFWSMLTVNRNPDWKTNLALFTADSAKAPNSIRLHNGMGSELYNQLLREKDPPEAEKTALLEQIKAHSRAALAVRENPVSYLNLGNAAIARNEYAEAIRQYEAALQLAPNYGIARINIGRTYKGWGLDEGKRNNNLPRAAELLEKALEYGQKDADLYLNLGAAYGMMGQNEKALPYFEQSVQLDPNNRNAWRNLSVAYRAVGQLAKAEECARKAKGE